MKPWHWVDDARLPLGPVSNLGVLVDPRTLFSVRCFRMKKTGSVEAKGNGLGVELLTALLFCTKYTTDTG
jgi:hypothetical protein